MISAIKVSILSNEQSSASECPRRLGIGDELRPVIGSVAKTLVVREYPSKLRIVALALVDQHPNELCMDELVVPLPGRPDALNEKRRDCRLKASIVAAFGATVVPAIDGFGFRGE